MHLALLASGLSGDTSGSVCILRAAIHKNLTGEPNDPSGRLGFMTQSDAQSAAKLFL
jgi:hypothetical protein